MVTGQRAISGLVMSCLLWLGLSLAVPMAALGQSTRYPLWPPEDLHPEMLIELKRQVFLDSSQQLLALPFRREPVTELALQLRFSVPDSVGDTLYIYVGGIGGEVSCWLGDHFLDWGQPRGKAWASPLPVDLLREVLSDPGQSVKLRIRAAEPVGMSPPRHLAVQGPIGLIRPDTWRAFQAAQPEAVPSADSVAVLPAYYRRYGWEFQPVEAMRNLQPVLDLGIRHVYFPFPPDPQLRRLCQQYGLQEVATLAPGTHLIWTAWYPVAEGHSTLPDAYWLDGQGGRTEYYGIWLQQDQLVYLPGENPYREPLIFLMLWLLGLLLFLRLVFPGMYAMQMTWLVLGSSMNIGGENLPGPTWLWLLSRWMVLAAALALAVVLLRSQGLWLDIRPEHTPGLAWNWLSQSDKVWDLWWRSLLMLILIDSGRYLLAALGGVAFGIKRFAATTIRLDLMSVFPTGWLLGLPFLAGSLYPMLGWGSLVLGAILWGIHLMRMVMVQGVGLNQWHGFSVGLNFLYICSLKVLPYTFLW